MKFVMVAATTTEMMGERIDVTPVSTLGALTLTSAGSISPLKSRTSADMI
jgi:hypothetical protein